MYLVILKDGLVGDSTFLILLQTTIHLKEVNEYLDYIGANRSNVSSVVIIIIVVIIIVILYILDVWTLQFWACIIIFDLKLIRWSVSHGGKKCLLLASTRLQVSLKLSGGLYLQVLGYSTNVLTKIVVYKVMHLHDWI